ncbi:MAG: hypothetical protein V1753_12640 [Pseudomonadota bacterium]
MIAHKKDFYKGAGLFAGFVAIFAVILTPIFDGMNGLDYLDSLYNSISKGSAYYIPSLKEKEVKKLEGKNVSVTLELQSPQQAQETMALFMKGNALVNVSDASLKVSGDLGAITANCLEDSDKMFKNDGEYFTAKYGYDAKKVLYNWWVALKKMDKELKKQELFSEAKLLGSVQKRAVECSYNYYQIKPDKISDRMGIVLFSLVFYVIYTVWYGFAVLYMCEGWGLKLGH